MCLKLCVSINSKMLCASAMEPTLACCLSFIAESRLKQCFVPMERPSVRRSVQHGYALLPLPIVYTDSETQVCLPVCLQSDSSMLRNSTSFDGVMGPLKP